MNTRSRTAAVPPSYQDFEPSSEWVRDEKSETLLIKLPGFKKEQMKVQIDGYRYLQTSGERPLDSPNNRWSRFRKHILIPETLNLTGVRAKFENGTLSIIFPKLIIETPPQPTQAQEPPATEKVEKTEPKPTETRNEKEKEQAKLANKEAVDGNADDQGGVKSVHNDVEERWVGSGGSGSAAAIGARWLGKKWNGVGGVVGVKEKRRRVFLNAVVALLLLVGLGVYVACKGKRDMGADSN